jgi:hypothetical protein
LVTLAYGKGTNFRQVIPAYMQGTGTDQSPLLCSGLSSLFNIDVKIPQLVIKGTQRATQ